MITFSDIQATKRQLSGHFQANPDVDQSATTFLPLYLPFGFDKTPLLYSADAGKALMGFRMDTICHLAGWGIGEAAPMIVTGVNTLQKDIVRAFELRNFSKSEVSGVEVWRRDSDSNLHMDANDAAPFGGMVGASENFAFHDGALKFSREVDQLGRMLSDNGSLATISEVTAIIDAVTLNNEFGEAIEVSILPDQPDRLENVAGRLSWNESLTGNEIARLIETWPGFDLPGVPGFERYAIVHWREKANVTGSIVIPFVEYVEAKLASERIEQNLLIMDSMINRAPVVELLPQPRSS